MTLSPARISPPDPELEGAFEAFEDPQPADSVEDLKHSAGFALDADEGNTDYSNDYSSENSYEESEFEEYDTEPEITTESTTMEEEYDSEFSEFSNEDNAEPAELTVSAENEYFNDNANESDYTSEYVDEDSSTNYENTAVILSEDVEETDYKPDLPDTESEVDPSEELPESGDEDDYEVDAEAAESDDDEEFVDPRAAKSKVALSSNPIIKAAFVGAVGLAVVLVGGGIYSALTGSANQKGPSLTYLEEAEAEPIAEPSPLTESGKLKAELAFSSQSNDLEKARRLQAAQAQPTPTPQPNQSPTPTSVISSVPIPSPPVIQPPVVRPMTPTVAAPIPVPTPVDPYAELSPVERWQQIAQLGSFGRSTITSRPMPASVPAVPAASAPAPATPATPATPAASASGGPTLAQMRSVSNIPGVRNAPLADVLTGTNATGTMQTSVILGEDNAEAVDPSNSNAVKYLVMLTSPIKDGTGAVAIPAGAQLVAVVSSFSPQSGLMQLSVRAVIHNNKEYTAPDGAIVIRGGDGASLRARRIGGGNDVMRALLPAAMQGISQAAETLTRSRGTTVTNGSSTVTTNDNRPNPTAGFAQGFAGSLSQQIQQATQQANAQNQSRPRPWRLEKGTAVNVFVNSTFQM